MRRTTRSAGAIAPCSSVVRDCVPRMPSVSQSSRTATRPSASSDAGHECVDHLGRVRRGGVQAVQAELRPHRGERGEDLGARERIGAVGLGRGIRVAAEQHQIVAGLADAEGEDLAGRGALLHEAQVVDAAIGEHLRDSGPHEMHVDREGGRRGRAGEPLLQDGCLGERQPGTAEFPWHEDRQVAGVLRARRGPARGTCSRGRGRPLVRGCARADRREGCRSGRSRSPCHSHLGTAASGQHRGRRAESAGRECTPVPR